MAKKSEPLSLESLLEAQQRMLTASNLTEDQRKRAEEQIAKLEELRKAATETQDKQTEVVDQIKVMTRAKGDSKNVTLGDVRTEIKEMRKDLKTFAGTDPNPKRKPLSRRDDVIDVDAKEVPGVSLNQQRQERIERLSNIGATLGEKAELYQKGAGKEVTMAKNTEAFERFVAETKRKDELLKDATDDQIKLFGRLEDTLIKLRDADAKNSVELRKELAKIAGELETTGDTAAKSKIGGVLENTRDRARSGARGDAGTLGDAWSALAGRKTVLKEGYEFDPRMGENAVRRTKDNELGKAGRLAQKGEVFSMGRVAGAAKIAGNFFRGKIEDYNAKNASNLGSDFLDRTFGGNRLEEDRARLGARAEALSQSRSNQTTAAPTPVFAGRGQPTAMPTAMPKSGAMNITASVVNLRGPLKLPGSGGPSWSAGNAGAGANKDWPPKPTVMPTTPAPMAAAAKSEEESSGFGLPDLNIMGRGRGLLGRAGSGIMSAGRGILSGGSKLLGKIPGGAIKGGIAALGGAALSYGGDKLKEAGYEKTGAAADIAGQAASWGGTGAMLGSVIPGVGTAIGAGVGAVAGGAYGLYKNWGSLFGGKKSEGNGAAVTPASSPVGKAMDMPIASALPPTSPVPVVNTASGAAGFPLATEQKKLSTASPTTPVAVNPVAKVTPVDKPAAKETDYTKDPRYQKLYEEQDTARKERYVKLYGEDIGSKMAAAPMSPTEQRNLDAATKERYMPVPNTQAIKKVDELSKSNAAVKDTSNKPIVIQQPAAAPAPAPAPAPQTFMPRGQVRSSESAMERYANRNSHFY